MRNLHKFIEDNYGLEALHLMQDCEKWEIKDSDYRNHRRFTSRYISKDLISVGTRLKFTSNSRGRRVKKIIHRVEKQLLQDRMKCVNGILCENAINLDRCRSRLLSTVTTTTGEECTDFISKVRDSRFIKLGLGRLINSIDQWGTRKGIGKLPHNP